LFREAFEQFVADHAVADNDDFHVADPVREGIH
jgi:hypothetical protein